MESTLFKITLTDGRIFKVFSESSAQKRKLFKSLEPLKKKKLLLSCEPIVNGIHKQFDWMKIVEGL